MFGLITEKKHQEILAKLKDKHDKEEADWLMQNMLIESKLQSEYTTFYIRKFICGTRGSGKTTFVKEKILKHNPHHLVIDPFDEYAGFNSISIPYAEQNTDEVIKQWQTDQRLLVIDGLGSLEKCPKFSQHVKIVLADIKNRPVNFVFVNNSSTTYTKDGRLNLMAKDICQDKAIYCHHIESSSRVWQSIRQSW